jgi:hypothetical protein
MICFVIYKKCDETNYSLVCDTAVLQYVKYISGSPPKHTYTHIGPSFLPAFPSFVSHTPQIVRKLLLTVVSIHTVGHGRVLLPTLQHDSQTRVLGTFSEGLENRPARNFDFLSKGSSQYFLVQLPHAANDTQTVASGT